LIKLACLLPVWKGDDPFAFQMAVGSVIDQQLSDDINLTIFFCLDGDLGKAKSRIIEQSSKFISIVSVDNKYSRGLANNLNSGLEEVLKSDFDYIARMDADDVCLNNRFSVQLKYLKENQDVDVVGSWSMIVNTKNAIVGEKKVQENVSLNSLSICCNVIHPTVVFRSNFFVKYGFYDEFYEKSQDWEFWLRAVRNGAVIKNIQQSLLMLRIDNKLICRRKREQYYNRKIIFKYSKGLVKYKGIARSWLIQLLPSAALKFMLNRAYRK
jgi:hypothetical protein